MRKRPGFHAFVRECSFPVLGRVSASLTAVSLLILSDRVLSFTPAQNESILWEGKGVPVRWVWLLDLVMLVVAASSLVYGTVLGFVVGLVVSILWISTLMGAIIATLTVRTSRYIVTNSRIVLGIGLVAKRTWELPLQLVSSIDVPQSTSQKEGGVGKILFRSFQARSIAFVRAREPMKVRQIALEAKSRLPSLYGQGPQVIEREIVTREVLIQCPNCGSHYPQGTIRCANCGATL